MRRAAIGAAIVVLWLAGLAMMLRRSGSRSEQQDLAEIALRLQPATFYYVVERNGRQIGAAASALDTTTQSLISEDYYVGEHPTGDSTERVSGRWHTRLSRAMRLSAMSILVTRPREPFALSALVQDDSTLTITRSSGSRKVALGAEPFGPPLFTPSLAPVALMLGGARKLGDGRQLAMFDPLTRKVIRPQLTIRAESLFVVVDSANLDPRGDWAVAHRDTVRAWRIEGAPHGVTAWVDDTGRIVAASAPNGISVTRTAFELAFRKPRGR